MNVISNRLHYHSISSNYFFILSNIAIAILWKCDKNPELHDNYQLIDALDSVIIANQWHRNEFLVFTWEERMITVCSMLEFYSYLFTVVFSCNTEQHPPRQQLFSTEFNIFLYQIHWKCNDTFKLTLTIDVWWYREWVHWNCVNDRLDVWKNMGSGNCRFISVSNTEFVWNYFTVNTLHFNLIG